MSNTEWKDLEIGNIPGDFFVNEGYEIQFLIDGIDGIDGSYTDYQEVEYRYKIISNKQLQGDNIKYRYRLKPLESIRITKAMCDDYATYMTNAGHGQILDEMSERYGHPVEIIGDSE